MKKPMLALISVAAITIMSGCASQQQAGVANGGSLSNLKKFAKENAAIIAKCDDPKYLFLTPDACQDKCPYMGSPAWSSTADLGVNRGLFMGDSFTTFNHGAQPLHLIGTQQEIQNCIRECKVNTQAIQDCKDRGFWHPDKIIRHYQDVQLISNADQSYRQELQPTFDPDYYNQRIIVAIKNSGGDIGSVVPTDRITSASEAIIAKLVNRPMIVSTLNALGQALGRSDVIHMTAGFSMAQSFQASPIKSYNKNPAGVQWPITFDGNISVDQSVN